MPLSQLEGQAGTRCSGQRVRQQSRAGTTPAVSQTETSESCPRMPRSHRISRLPVAWGMTLGGEGRIGLRRRSSRGRQGEGSDTARKAGSYAGLEFKITRSALEEGAPSTRQRDALLRVIRGPSVRALRSPASRAGQTVPDVLDRRFDRVQLELQVIERPLLLVEEPVLILEHSFRNAVDQVDFCV